MTEQALKLSPGNSHNLKSVLAGRKRGCAKLNTRLLDIFFGNSEVTGLRLSGTIACWSRELSRQRVPEANSSQIGVHTP
jgi:hypothetical protein